MCHVIWIYVVVFILYYVPFQGYIVQKNSWNGTRVVLVLSLWRPRDYWILFLGTEWDVLPSLCGWTSAVECWTVKFKCTRMCSRFDNSGCQRRKLRNPDNPEARIIYPHHLYYLHLTLHITLSMYQGLLPYPFPCLFYFYYNGKEKLERVFSSLSIVFTAR